ncbi:F-box only protein 42 [Halotydeus destructor]|nr:F-box only protein 42 [Halotydeus destructor]
MTENGCISPINRLPNELLEYLLSYLTPYEDLEHCKWVCKRWKKLVEGARVTSKREFDSCLSSGKLQWSSFLPNSKAPPITGRSAHASCKVGSKVYVFGGCTPNHTTFNDLWVFHLSTRKWERKVTNGSLPQAKCYASMVHHDGHLILFGGWTPTSTPAPPFYVDGWKTYGTVHLYDIGSNCWIEQATTPSIWSELGLSGHSATIICSQYGPLMLVFGGKSSRAPGLPLQNADPPTNKLSVLNLSTWTWSEPDLLNPEVMPSPRYGHSQEVVKAASNSAGVHHIIVAGGCSGPNNLKNDIWLLSYNDETNPYCFWSQINLVSVSDNKTEAQIGLHSACKIGEKIVILNKSHVAKPVKRKDFMNIGPKTRTSVQTFGEFRITHHVNPIQFYNGQPSYKQNGLPSQFVVDFPLCRVSMTVHVLDVSRAISEKIASWYPINCEPSNGPEHMILYSLIAGENELIMFGGVPQPDYSAAFYQPRNSSASASNLVYILSARRIVI